MKLSLNTPFIDEKAQVQRSCTSYQKSQLVSGASLWTWAQAPEATLLISIVCCLPPWRFGTAKDGGDYFLWWAGADGEEGSPGVVWEGQRSHWGRWRMSPYFSRPWGISEPHNNMWWSFHQGGMLDFWSLGGGFTPGDMTTLPRKTILADMPSTDKHCGSTVSLGQSRSSLSLLVMLSWASLFLPLTALSISNPFPARAHPCAAGHGPAPPLSWHLCPGWALEAWTAWAGPRRMGKFSVCLRHGKSFNRNSHSFVLHPSSVLTVPRGLLRRAGLKRPAALTHPPSRVISKISFR